MTPRIRLIRREREIIKIEAYLSKREKSFGKVQRSFLFNRLTIFLWGFVFGVIFFVTYNITTNYYLLNKIQPLRTLYIISWKYTKQDSLKLEHYKTIVQEIESPAFSCDTLCNDSLYSELEKLSNSYLDSCNAIKPYHSYIEVNN